MDIVESRRIKAPQYDTKEAACTWLVNDEIVVTDEVKYYIITPTEYPRYHALGFHGT